MPGLRHLQPRTFTRARGSGLAPYIQVVTPSLSYEKNGDTTYILFGDDLDSRRHGLTLDFVYIAQHSSDFGVSYVGEGQVGSTTVKAIKLQLSGANLETVWKIDPQSGRILSTVDKTRTGETVSEYSDFRNVGGLTVPFKRHIVAQGMTSDITTTQYELNAEVQATLFDRPADLPSDQLTLKVLQADQVPYTQQIGGGGLSANCNISGSANTIATTNTAGNMTFGNGTTNSAMQMSCNSYDTTIRWPHMLNMMLIEASDGNAYIIECDKAWRWSKCGPLNAGQTFNARFTPKGIEVEAVTAKGQSIKPVYGIVQSRAMR